MVLFLIFLAIPVLALIGALWYAIAQKEVESAAGFFGIVLAIMFIPIMIVGAMTFSGNPDRVDRFIFEKPLIEGSDNFLLIEKKNSWNEWLRGAQRGKITWGAFSMQPDEVLTLTPIE